MYSQMLPNTCAAHVHVSGTAVADVVGPCRCCAARCCKGSCAKHVPHVYARCEDLALPCAAVAAVAAAFKHAFAADIGAL